MRIEVRQILATTGFFRSLSEQSLDLLADIGRLVHFKQGRTIFHEADPCPGVYAVKSGAVRIFRLAPNGKEHLLHLAEEGHTFAEVAAIGRFACPANAEALEDTVCALLPLKEFLHLLDSDHQLCLQLISSMAQWVRQLIGLMEDIVLRDAAGRLSRHILRSAEAKGTDDFSLAMRKKDLACHLNLTSETLSRTLRRLAAQGLIETTSHQRLRVLDKAGLQAIVEG